MPRSHGGEIKYWRERAELAERERETLSTILQSLLPPEHGLHGGPLVGGEAHYEDGSTIVIPYDVWDESLRFFKNNR